MKTPEHLNEVDDSIRVKWLESEVKTLQKRIEVFETLIESLAEEPIGTRFGRLGEKIRKLIGTLK